MYMITAGPMRERWFGRGFTQDYFVNDSSGRPLRKITATASDIGAFANLSDEIESVLSSRDGMSAVSIQLSASSVPLSLVDSLEGFEKQVSTIKKAWKLRKLGVRGLSFIQSHVK